MSKDANKYTVTIESADQPKMDESNSAQVEDQTGSSELSLTDTTNNGVDSQTKNEIVIADDAVTQSQGNSNGTPDIKGITAGGKKNKSKKRIRKSNKKTRKSADKKTRKSVKKELKKSLRRRK